MEVDESYWWSMVYIKELKSEVSIIVEDVPDDSLQAFQETAKIDFRGMLKPDGTLVNFKFTDITC